MRDRKMFKRTGKVINMSCVAKKHVIMQGFTKERALWRSRLVRNKMYCQRTESGGIGNVRNETPLLLCRSARYKGSICECCRPTGFPWKRETVGMKING
ncbi:hypothetical protein HOLleu_04888 [Holothuria leucospilota]|uniref:Uncharacterized protein n=1 Tax=Holothuria leucospilota TaxID=206669 RepID=A0A9Q1CKK3_HOLLE|nr:hypothetical protein HOLleu_04888 [Holothuria leucospilota]